LRQARAGVARQHLVGVFPRSRGQPHRGVHPDAVARDAALPLRCRLRSARRGAEGGDPGDRQDAGRLRQRRGLAGGVRAPVRAGGQAAQPQREFSLSRVTSEMFEDNAQNWLFSRMRAFDEVHPDWMLYLCQIAAGIMSLDINDFINWTVIKLTIFTDDQGLLTSKQVDFLKSSLEWEPRIRPALVESPVGNPPFSRIKPPTGAARIRQAYILKRYELEFGCNIEECDLIVEFGGGYGAIALLACKYGLSGKSIIIDNEPMSSLQAWYLSENAGPVHYGTDIGEEPGIYFAGLSDYDTIETAVKNAERPIFLANWSLSETPADLRMRTMEW